MILSKFIQILIIGLLAIVALQAQTAEEQFYQATELCSEGKYTVAAEMFESILEEGQESVSLYYNLGNAYFQLDKIGKAVLNYERALRLSPKQADVLHNLSLAKGQIAKKIDPYPVIFYKTWWRNIAGLFSSTFWAFLCLAGVWGAFVMGLRYLKSKEAKQQKRYFLFASIALALSLLFLLLANYQNYKEVNKDFAVLTASEIVVSSGPSSSSEILFSLSDGLKVRLIDQVDDWVKVLLPDGKEGWVEANKLEVI